jgi:hypothetical protein
MHNIDSEKKRREGGKQDLLSKIVLYVFITDN